MSPAERGEPWIEDPGDLVRPLRLGAAIGHPEGSEGTLGPFVILANGRRGFLSAAHVLSPKGAKRGDFIHQPGPLHRLPTGETRIATFIRSDSSTASDTDIRTLPGVGLAELLEEVPILGNRLPLGRGEKFLAAAVPPEQLKVGDEVGLVARSGVHRRGVVTDVEIVGLAIEGVGDKAVAPEVFAVRGKKEPFSARGDAGGIVYRVRDRAAMGILFAAEGISSPEAHSFAIPLAPALQRLGARLLE